MHKNAERNAIKLQWGGDAGGPASVSQFWEIKRSSVVGPDASSRCNLSEKPPLLNCGNHHCMHLRRARTR